MITIKSIDDLTTAIKDNKSIHVAGNGTKTGLHSHISHDVQHLRLSGLIGITEYQPDEYTITAQAGTPVKVIQDALAKNGQYLPFDPMLADTATIGGTVASNLSGSRRFRYGGVRDFILGASVVDGQGRSFRVGGKVVKNSAGFDLTKFLVGSLGQYAVMTQVTFKVFPDVSEFVTLKLHYSTLDNLLSAVYFLNQNVFELDALDFHSDGDKWVLLGRMTGLSDTLADRAQRFISTLDNNTSLLDSSQSQDNAVWDSHNALSWAQSRSVAKIVLSPKQIPLLEASLRDTDFAKRYSVGGNMAWIATTPDKLSQLHSMLADLNLTGMLVIGEGENPILGKSTGNSLSERVKQIFDPENKLI
jgi:glycolate oxidase FAD binding subunit